jgi:large subunit ribosomal protein L7Ae
MAITIYDTIEKASKTGKVDRGVNEVTKAVERGIAKAIVIASDVEPKELTQHLPILCKEKGIPCVEADSKEKLGITSGINRSTAAIAILEAGDADLATLK